MTVEEARLSVEEIIRRVFGLSNISFASSHSISGGESEPQNAIFKISDFNSVLRDSSYDFDFQNKSSLFVHFTTLKNLLNIIREKSLRLYDLNNMEDPREWNYAADAFKDYVVSHDLIREYKHQVFSFSMMEFTQEVMNNEYIFWKLYGDGGRGVAVVFKISPENQYEWFQTFLGKINYDNIDRFQIFVREVSKLFSKHSFSIGDPFEAIFPLLSLHKSGIYRFENEVRILKIIQKNLFAHHDDPQINSDFNLQLKKVFYYNYPISDSIVEGMDEELRITFLKNHLKVRIEKVIFGHNMNVQQYIDMSSLVTYVAWEKLGYNVQVERSKLWDHYNAD